MGESLATRLEIECKRHMPTMSQLFHSPPLIPNSESPDQPPQSDVLLSQPKVQKDSLQISAKVTQDRVTWAQENTISIQIGTEYLYVTGLADDTDCWR